jgi:diphthamide biosynthesis methyltransferase
MGDPLHSLCICGDMHEIELEMYHHFLYKPHKEEQQEESKD